MLQKLQIALVVIAAAAVCCADLALPRRNCGPRFYNASRAIDSRLRGPDACCTYSYCNCPYPSSSCCDTGKCCVGIGTDFCCSNTVASCCASTSTYYGNSKCCGSSSTCCKSSSGYTVDCCNSTQRCNTNTGLCEAKSSGLAVGVIVGIAVGVTLLPCIIIACVVCCVIAAANSKKRNAAASSYTPSTTTTAVYTTAGPPGYSAAATPQQTQLDPRLAAALDTVKKGIVVALVGIANDRITVDEGITLMALAVTEAASKYPCETQAEFDKALAACFLYMDALFYEIIPSMQKQQREQLITAVLQRMTSLAQQQKKQRIEDSLEAIRQSIVAVWGSVVTNKISLEDAEQLMGVAVAAALRNCSITTADQLKAHIEGFTRWMMVLSDQVAPGVPAEVKAQTIRRIWEKAASHF